MPIASLGVVQQILAPLEFLREVLKVLRCDRYSVLGLNHPEMGLQLLIVHFKLRLIFC